MDNALDPTGFIDRVTDDLALAAPYAERLVAQLTACDLERLTLSDRLEWLASRTPATAAEDLATMMELRCVAAQYEAVDQLRSGALAQLRYLLSLPAGQVAHLNAQAPWEEGR